MSVSGRNWRFPTIPAGSASLVRGKTDWIRNLRLSVEQREQRQLRLQVFDRQLQTVFDGCLAGRYSRNRMATLLFIKPHRQLHDDTAPRIEVGCVLTRIARARDCGCVHPILAPGSEIRPAYLNPQRPRLHRRMDTADKNLL